MTEIYLTISLSTHNGDDISQNWDDISLNYCNGGTTQKLPISS